MKFWAVSTKYFDSGRVKVNIYPVEAETKPESGMTENKMCDHYIDYFDRVILLAQGREVFFGTPSELQSFFWGSQRIRTHSETLISEIMRQCSFSVYDNLFIRRQQRVDLDNLISKYRYYVELHTPQNILTLRP